MKTTKEQKAEALETEINEENDGPTNSNGMNIVDALKSGQIKIKARLTTLVGTNKITGDFRFLFGDASGLRGDVSGLSGDVSDLSGDVSGLSGDVSGLSGNIQEAVEAFKKEQPVVPEAVAVPEPAEESKPQA